ncbi:hypothetical protein MKX01_029461 [Papaver californicum]|nr:hypothetical protein MKX01_029461 [Papaver californicum]
MDESDEDQILPHNREPKELSFDRLNELGVLRWSLDEDNYETDEELKKVRAKRGYTCVDFCQVCPAKMPNYDQKIKDFFEEHLHTDEEICYCVDGSGYFDVRDENEKWIRVWVKKGGMIVLPAGHNPLQLSTLVDQKPDDSEDVGRLVILAFQGSNMQRIYPGSLVKERYHNIALSVYTFFASLII